MSLHWYKQVREITKALSYSRKPTNKCGGNDELEDHCLATNMILTNSGKNDWC